MLSGSASERSALVLAVRCNNDKDGNLSGGRSYYTISINPIYMDPDYNSQTCHKTHAFCVRLTHFGPFLALTIG